MISVDRASAVPPFDQIREQLADTIRAGGLEFGARLPSIRQLAGDLRVAPGTVARAYRELSDMGLISVSRAGVHVQQGQQLDPETREAALRFVSTARSASLGLEDALGAIRASWAAALPR